MAHAHAVELEAEDRVRAARRPCHVVVLGRDRHNLADRRLEASGGRANRLRVASDRVDTVVVAVLVRHEQEIGFGVDRRVVELETVPARRLTHVGERIDEHAAAPGQQERGLSVPANTHEYLLRSCRARTPSARARVARPAGSPLATRTSAPRARTR